MSYCRFSEGDVYMYASSQGGIECCACAFVPQHSIVFGHTKLKTVQEAYAHLIAHRQAGHAVPQDALDQLLEEGAQPF